MGNYTWWDRWSKGKREYKEQKEKVTTLIWKSKFKVKEDLFGEWEHLSAGEKEKRYWRFMKDELNGGVLDRPVVLKDGELEVGDETAVQRVIEEYWMGINNIRRN